MELLLTDLHNKDAKPKEVVEAVYEKLIEILGNKKAKEMMEKIAAIFKVKVPEPKASSFFTKITNFFTHLLFR